MKTILLILLKVAIFANPVTGYTFPADGYELRAAVAAGEFNNPASAYGHPINDWDVSGMYVVFVVHYKLESSIL